MVVDDDDDAHEIYIIKWSWEFKRGKKIVFY